MSYLRYCIILHNNIKDSQTNATYPDLQGDATRPFRLTRYITGCAYIEVGIRYDNINVALRGFQLLDFTNEMTPTFTSDSFYQLPA